MDPLPEVPPPASDAQALLGLVMTVGSLALVPLAVFLVRALVPERRVFFARWGFLDVLKLVMLTVVLAVVVSGAGAVAGLGDSPAVDLALSALALGGASAYVLLVASSRDPAGVRCLGLWPGRNGRSALAGAIAYALLLPAILGAGAWWPWVFERLGGEYELQAIVQQIAELRGAGLAATVVLAVLVQPFFEELLFRSFLQPLLVQNLGDRGGVAATSVAFGALHGPSAFVPVFVLSLVLGFVMLRTQRLAAAWAVHALHNGLQLALLFLAPEAGEALGRAGLLGGLGG